MNTRDEENILLETKEKDDEEMQQFISDIIDAIIEAMD